MNLKLFCLFFIIGISSACYGGYSVLVQSNSSATLPGVPLSPDASMAFYYTPTPSGNENNPLSVNAVLYPLVNHTNMTELDLSIFGGFSLAPPQVSFSFESSFNVTISSQRNGSGDGVGTWKTYNQQISNGKPGTTIEWQFNLNTSSPLYHETNDTSFTEATASLIFSGLPYDSKPGEYTFYLPFTSTGAGEPADSGQFILCSPAGFQLTSSSENYTASTCSGGREGYQFNDDQLNEFHATQLVVSVTDSSLENAYSKAQTYGLFSLGVGVPAMIASLTFLDPSVDSKFDKLDRKIESLKEEMREENSKLDKLSKEIELLREEVKDEEQWGDEDS
jgi:hypothetical protein